MAIDYPKQSCLIIKIIMPLLHTVHSCHKCWNRFRFISEIQNLKNSFSMIQWCTIFIETYNLIIVNLQRKPATLPFVWFVKQVVFSSAALDFSMFPLFTVGKGCWCYFPPPIKQPVSCFVVDLCADYFENFGLRWWLATVIKIRHPEPNHQLICYSSTMTINANIFYSWFPSLSCV